MKKSYIVLLMLYLISCGNRASNFNKEIYGTWILSKEKKGNNEIDLDEKTSAVSLNLKNNGYFILFDKINDKEMTESGVRKIQERFKGQFVIQNDQLEMKYYENDSLIKSSFTINEISTEKLVLQDEKTGLIQFWKR